MGWLLLSRRPSGELLLGCWLLPEFGGCRRQAVNRKWLSKSRWSMLGAGAEQEIAEQLNGLRRMLCPPPQGFGKGAVCPLLPALHCEAQSPEPSSSLTPQPLFSSAGAGGGAGGEGPRVPGPQEVQPALMEQEGRSSLSHRAGVRPISSGSSVRGWGWGGRQAVQAQRLFPSS